MYEPTDEESGGEEESSDDYSEEESDWEGEEDASGTYQKNRCCGCLRNRSALAVNCLVVKHLSHLAG